MRPSWSRITIIGPALLRTAVVKFRSSLNLSSACFRLYLGGEAVRDGLKAVNHQVGFQPFPQIHQDYGADSVSFNIERYRNHGFSARLFRDISVKIIQLTQAGFAERLPVLMTFLEKHPEMGRRFPLGISFPDESICPN